MNVNESVRLHANKVVIFEAVIFRPLTGTEFFYTSLVV